MPSIKIAHIVPSFGVGGMENGIVNLINTMDAEKFSFCLFSFLDQSASVARITNDRVYIEVIPKKDGNDWRLPLRLAHRLKEHNVDIVHSHCWGTYIEALLASKVARIPVITHGEHGTDHLDKRRRIIAYKIGAKITDQMLTVSQDLCDRFVRQYHISPHRVKSIMNGVNCQKFQPSDDVRQAWQSELALDDDHVVIGTVGRLSFEKDYQTLLEAFALVVKQSPKARLLLIGDGPDRGKLLVLTEQLNLSGSVKFLGMRSDVPALLNALDIFVLSSISEGIPNTILEAMCVGLPVVSTKVGGVPEIVQDGITGLLSRSRDPQSLANALTKLVVSSSLRRKMGDAGKAIVRERFSLESMVKAYEENYVELLSKKKRRMSAASR